MVIVLREVGGIYDHEMVSGYGEVLIEGAKVVHETTSDCSCSFDVDAQSDVSRGLDRGGS